MTLAAYAVALLKEQGPGGEGDICARKPAGFPGKDSPDRPDNVTIIVRAVWRQLCPPLALVRDNQTRHKPHVCLQPP